MFNRLNVAVNSIILNLKLQLVASISTSGREGRVGRSLHFVVIGDRHCSPQSPLLHGSFAQFFISSFPVDQHFRVPCVYLCSPSGY